MATRHTCDRCGAEVDSHDKLYRLYSIPVSQITDNGTITQGLFNRNPSRKDLCAVCVSFIFQEANAALPSSVDA